MVGLLPMLAGVYNPDNWIKTYRCVPYYGLDRVSITNGIVESLDQQTTSAFTTTESGPSGIIREALALCRQCSHSVERTPHGRVENQ